MAASMRLSCVLHRLSEPHATERTGLRGGAAYFLSRTAHNTDVIIKPMLNRGFATPFSCHLSKCSILSSVWGHFSIFQGTGNCYGICRAPKISSTTLVQPWSRRFSEAAFGRTDRRIPVCNLPKPTRGCRKHPKTASETAKFSESEQNSSLHRRVNTILENYRAVRQHAASCGSNLG